MNTNSVRFNQPPVENWGRRWPQRPSEREINHFIRRELRDIRGVRDARWTGSEIRIKVKDSDSRRRVEDAIYDYFGRRAPPYSIKVQPDWVDIATDIIDIFKNR
jgi:hypothetical protein